MLTVYAFGDSILDCGRYNAAGVTPGRLLVRNDDRPFPECHGQDLSSSGPVGAPRAGRCHRARPAGAGRRPPGSGHRGRRGGPGGGGRQRPPHGSGRERGPGIAAFARALEAFLQGVPVRPVLLGSVYDPTFGDDDRNFLGVDPALARMSHRRLNEALAGLAARFGALVDLHAHFLTGESSWFTRTIEPSLRGASEIRRAFWPHVSHHQPATAGGYG